MGVLFEPRPHTLAVIGGPGAALVFPPFFGDIDKERFALVHIHQAFLFLPIGRVDTSFYAGFGFFELGAGLLEGHLGVGAHSQRFLFPRKAVVEAPAFGAVLSHQQAQCGAVVQPIVLFPGRRFAHHGVGEFLALVTCGLLTLAHLLASPKIEPVIPATVPAFILDDNKLGKTGLDANPSNYGAFRVILDFIRRG